MTHRRLRQGLIHFLDALALHLQAGFDLGHSWPETLRSLASVLPPELIQELQSGPGLTANLGRLAHSYSMPMHRMWFGVLKELYGTGAGMSEAVRGISINLRKEHERDLETHCRTLPTKINVCLILFFLPPTFLVLFVPLVIEIINNFN